MAGTIDGQTLPACDISKIRPDGLGEFEQVLRIAPCFSESTAVVCAVIKVTKGSNPIVRGWGETAEAEFKPPQYESYQPCDGGCEQRKKACRKHAKGELNDARRRKISGFTGSCDRYFMLEDLMANAEGP